MRVAVRIRLTDGALPALAVVCAAWCSASAFAGPRIACAKPTHDFGTVGDVETLSHRFVLQNTGDAPIIIEDVQSTCGCATSRLPTNSIPPRGQVEIETFFSLSGRRGPQAKSLYVRSNDPAQPFLRLELLCNIRRAIERTPSQIAFPNVDDPGADPQTLRIAFNLDKTVRILEIDARRAPSCAAQIAPLGNEGDYRLSVRLKPDHSLPMGYTRETLSLLTDHPQHPRIDIPVLLNRRPEIQVVPPELNFTTRSAAAAERRYLLVRSEANQPIRVLSVVPPVETIQTAVKELRDGIHRVELSNIILTPELNGTAIQIRLRKQDGSEQTLEVPVRIRGKGQS